MGDYLWLPIGLAALGLGFLAYRAGRVWIDADRRGFGLTRRLGWALLGSVIPSRYWWGARVEALSPEERADLLARETAALGLSRADGLRCPLCRAEVVHAWALTPDGHPTVAPGPVECPRCDFRLDACRHCAHFLPGSPRAWGQISYIGGDSSFGRCGRRRVSQPVEEACAPDVARQMKARGWDRVRAPMPIVDSFLPPDDCTAFAPDRKRLQAGGVRWPDARRTALLRMLLPPPETAMRPPEEPSSDEEQWLL
jgi:hypothetical protein